MVVSRFQYAKNSVTPDSVIDSKAAAFLNKRFDHTAYRLKPKHGVYAQQCMINDDIPLGIATGSLVVKSNVKRLTETGVEFEDGTFEDNVDVVIYATGYIISFPFIDEEIIKVTNNKVNLFKYVFPPDLKPATLAVIGCFQPLGSIMPLAEMQGRWTAKVFKVNTIKVSLLHFTQIAGSYFRIRTSYNATFARTNLNGSLLTFFISRL